MARNYYSELHLHLIWHTKLSLPLLTAQVEPLVHRYLRQKLINWPGAYVHEIGGTETHVHVAVTLAPTILVSDLVGKLKGSSSHEVNQHLGQGRKLLEWQAGYGVVSFGTKDLEWVNSYIRHQREHHARGRVFDRLERVQSAEAEAQGSSRPARSPVNGAAGKPPLPPAPVVNDGPTTAPRKAP
jgi:putative transposase